MHEYDMALKSILMRPGSALLSAIAGSDRMRWLTVETPTVRNLRVDLLGQLPDGSLVQIEFQSRNERYFPIRMGEYLFAIGRTHKRLPRQIVLYVGEPKLRMKDRMEGPNFSFRFHMIDIRDLDGEALLASSQLGDNILALLTGLGSQPGTVRRILDRICRGPREGRDQALTELVIVAGLRRLTGEVRREAKRMPIHLDIRDDEVLGPIIRQKEEAAARAARMEGQTEILLSMIEKRFGRVPPRVRKRLASMNPEEVMAAGLRLLDAQRIDDLFAD